MELPLSAQVENLAEVLCREGALPAKARIEAVCRAQGFEPPRISTPLELLGIHRH